MPVVAQNREQNKETACDDLTKVGGAGAAEVAKTNSHMHS